MKWPILLVSLLLGGCQTFHKPSVDHAVTQGDYWAAGRIAIKNADESHQGPMQLELSQEGHLRLLILAPVLGTKLYEIRATSEHWMILNFRDATYVLHPNTAEIRQQYLGVDLVLYELEWVLHGQGTVDGKPPSKVFEKNDHRYETELSEDGRLQSLRKYHQDRLLYQVEISQYGQFQQQSFPQKIKITDPTSGRRLILFIEDLALVSKQPPIDWSVPEGFQK